MSFPDERTRKAETAKNDVIQSKILRSGGKRMEPVKAELEKLRELKQKDPTKEELIEQHKKLIEACRTYMKPDPERIRETGLRNTEGALEGPGRQTHADRSADQKLKRGPGVSETQAGRTEGPGKAA